MAKWHIKKDGTPGVCHAEKGSCPLGGASGMENHFDTQAEAQQAIDAKNAEAFSNPGNPVREAAKKPVNLDGARQRDTNPNHVEGQMNVKIDGRGDIDFKEFVDNRLGYSPRLRYRAKLLHALGENSHDFEHADATLDELKDMNFDKQVNMSAEDADKNMKYIRGIYSQIKSTPEAFAAPSARISRENAIMPHVVTLRDVKDFQHANENDKKYPITIYHMAKNYAELTEGLNKAELDKINNNEGLVAHFAKNNHMTPTSMKLGSSAGRTYLKKQAGIKYPKGSMGRSQSVVFSEYGAKVLPNNYDMNKINKALSKWAPETDGPKNLLSYHWTASSDELRSILGLK